jgi:hypothetical protein
LPLSGRRETPTALLHPPVRQGKFLEIEMKVVYIKAINDFDALQFEQMYASKLTLKHWGELQDKGGHLHLNDNDGNQAEIEYELYEFGAVDPKFISFVEEDIMDYDNSKHSNFYIVAEP